MARMMFANRMRDTARSRPIASVLGCAWLVLAAVPAAGQVGQVADPRVDGGPPPAALDTSTTVTPTTAAGRVGERQTRDDTAREAGIEPMARINNRIDNRIRSRLRTRLDRNYTDR